MRNQAAILLLSLVVGCSATRKYDIRVQNRTSEPITVGMVKEGGPYQPSWAAPEEAAIRQAKPDQSQWHVIPPGEELSSGTVAGRFYSDSRAMLRIYEGTPDTDEVLAISPGQPNRIDEVLRPGRSVFVVTERNGQITATTREDGMPLARR